MTTPFNLVRPCADCPFRSDKPFYLGRERRQQIADALLADKSFDCHKTVHYEEESWDEQGYSRRGDESHCAGATIVLEKEENPNQIMRWMERLGAYDRTAMDMDAPVFDTLEDFVEKGA